MNNQSTEAKAIETLFSIQDKYKSFKVPYKLNEAQRFFDGNDDAFNRTRIIVAKARQKGFSSIILAKLAVRCLGKEGTHAVCMSHEASSTQRLLDKVHFYLKHIKGPAPIYGRNSRTELYFTKTESTYYIGTAGSKAFGRGDWVTDLHCSEYAYWDDPVRHSTGLFQAVPQNGRIYIESTGNGRNNDFYYIWTHAEEMGYNRLFYPWFADKEYSLPLPLTKSVWRPDVVQHNALLLEMKIKHKLTDEQMYWYEMKLRELREDVHLMQQEYPSVPEECFQATGGSIFPSVELSISNQWTLGRTKDGKYVQKLEDHPKKNYNYVIGADPSGGTGNDDAAITIFCCETYEQVLEYANNTTNPIRFAELLIELGKEYNDAYVIPEANNHGAAVIPYLTTHYLKGRIYKRKFGTKTSPAKYGWNNSTISKHELIGLMQEMLDQLTIYGKQSVQELKGFEETSDGKLSGKSDNLVIALGLTMMGLRKYEMLRKEYLTPVLIEAKPTPNYMTYSLDDVLLDIKKRHNNTTNQVGVGYPNV